MSDKELLDKMDDLIDLVAGIIDDNTETVTFKETVGQCARQIIAALYTAPPSGVREKFSLMVVLDILKNDAYAASFQSTAQYRSALIKEIKKSTSATKPEHWVFDAAEKCYPLVANLHDSGSMLAKTHLLEMLETMRKREMSVTKACRWLGWIQAGIYCYNGASLEQLKSINKAASDAA